MFPISLLRNLYLLGQVGIDDTPTCVVSVAALKLEIESASGKKFPGNFEGWKLWVEGSKCPEELLLLIDRICVLEGIYAGKHSELFDRLSVHSACDFTKFEDSDDKKFEIAKLAVQHLRRHLESLYGSSESQSRTPMDEDVKRRIVFIMISLKTVLIYSWKTRDPDSKNLIGECDKICEDCYVTVPREE